MQLNLRDKVVLVTGSSKGIGKVIAGTFVHLGCKVILNGRNATNLEVAKNEIEGSDAYVGDMANFDEAKSVVNRIENKYGSLDIVVCNVGSGSSVAPGKENYLEWQRVFAINLWSTTNTVEAAKNIVEKSKGAFVCISSICGLEVIDQAPITYSVAKAALNAYVKGIARPLGKKGVRINAVAPGNVLFKNSVWESKLKKNKQAVENMLKRDVALSRFASPEEIASAVVYLSSPNAGFVTGSIWVVDGGQIH